MAKAPKCKLCGCEHWLSEPHRLTPNVTFTVTKPAYVTRTVTAVTPIVTEAMMIEAAVHDTHDCPVCGLSHHRALTATERKRRQRAKA